MTYYLRDYYLNLKGFYKALIQLNILFRIQMEARSFHPKALQSLTKKDSFRFVNTGVVFLQKYSGT